MNSTQLLFAKKIDSSSLFSQRFNSIAAYKVNILIPAAIKTRYLW